MSTMNISLPDSLKSFVDSQVAKGDYTSTSEYVREVLRKEKAEVRLRQLVTEGLESEPIDEPIDEKYFTALKDRIKTTK